MADDLRFSSEWRVDEGSGTCRRCLEIGLPIAAGPRRHHYRSTPSISATEEQHNHGQLQRRLLQMPDVLGEVLDALPAQRSDGGGCNVQRATVRGARGRSRSGSPAPVICRP